MIQYVSHLLGQRCCGKRLCQTFPRPARGTLTFLFTGGEQEFGLRMHLPNAIDQAESLASVRAIIRPEHGVVGAICINVDANYLTEEVLSSAEKVAGFFQAFCRTDMQVDENILSRDEYAQAIKGKRHFKHETF